MRSTDRVLMDKINERRPSRSFLGIFRSMSGSKALCETQYGEKLIPFGGGVQPSPGDSVQIEMRNGTYSMVGPAQPKPTRGTVTRVSAPGDPDPTKSPVGEVIPEGTFDEFGNPITAALPPDTLRCVVTAGTAEYWLPYMSSYTPTAGDIVAIQWGEHGGIVVGTVSTVPRPVSGGERPSTAPPTVTGYRPAPFTATSSGTYQSGSWSPGTVMSSDSGRGVFLYGNSIADTIPDTATITYTRLYLADEQIYGDPAQLRLHTLTALAGSPAWVGDPWPLAPVSGWQQIPNSFADWLKANPGGIGFDGGGFHIFKSVSIDPMCGALDIAYTA